MKCQLLCRGFVLWVRRGRGCISPVILLSQRKQRFWNRAKKMDERKHSSYLATDVFKMSRPILFCFTSLNFGCCAEAPESTLRSTLCRAFYCYVATHLISVIFCQYLWHSDESRKECLFFLFCRRIVFASLVHPVHETTQTYKSLFRLCEFFFNAIV